jgi:SAM-dependent methyltransferase
LPNETPKVRVSRQDRKQLAWPLTVIIKRKAEEFVSKARGKSYSGAGLVGADLSSVKTGFASLSHEQFDQYNLAQVWVERRQIPQALDGRVPVEHATIVDLGCGPGTSTKLLSYFAHPTWTLIGYDLTPEYIALARARETSGHFTNRAGQRITPRFVCQSISEPLRAHENSPQLLDASSVDFAISGGVVGLYLDRGSVFSLAQELWRVLKPGGSAAIDVGPAVSSSLLREAMHAAARAGGGTFRETGRAGSFVIEPRPKRIFEKAV